MRSGPGIKAVTPGKCLSKKAGRVEGSLSSSEISPLGMNRVQVKEPS
jgi:hypothetical protein